MIKIKPLNYRDLLTEFGNPDTAEGLDRIRSSQTTIHLPFPLVQGGRETWKIECHEYCAAAYRDVLEDILDRLGLETIKKYGLNVFHGCHVERRIIDPKTWKPGLWWSIHTWGMAFDHVAALGPNGSPSIMPWHFVEPFLLRGFGWGGHWQTQDGMHFSVTGT